MDDPAGWGIVGHYIIGPIIAAVWLVLRAGAKRRARHKIGPWKT